LAKESISYYDAKARWTSGAINKLMTSKIMAPMLVSLVVVLLLLIDVAASSVGGRADDGQ
jgi:hypothetical protein